MVKDYRPIEKTFQMTDTKIQINNLYKIFGDDPEKAMELVNTGISKQELLEKHGHVLGLRDINISIKKQKIKVSMGLSGSGKSTLIRHINRLIEPTSGSVIVDGDNILDMSVEELRAFRRQKASMVFQRFGLMPHRTVAQNVAYGLNIQGVDEDEAKTRSGRWIERVGLSGFEDHFPAQLSGGMQQRVGLARALTTDAEILLMDEAFSALDPLIRNDMQNILLDLQTELHKTIVFITHDLDEALRIGDSIAILRDGEVIQQGDPQSIIMKPADAYIEDFLKDINRGRVLRIQSIMEKTKGKGSSKIRFDTPIEDAIQHISKSSDGISNVVDGSGKVIGSVSLTAAIKALARPETKVQNETYR